MGKGIWSYLTPRFEGIVWRTVPMSSACSFPGMAKNTDAQPRFSGYKGARGEHDARATADEKKEPVIQLMMPWAASWWRYLRLVRGAAASGEKVGGAVDALETHERGGGIGREGELGFDLGWGRPPNDLNENENFISMVKSLAPCCPARALLSRTIRQLYS
jgi:hypothetical protein